MQSIDISSAAGRSFEGDSSETQRRPDPRIRRTYAIALVVITLLGLAVRVTFLRQPLKNDEAHTIVFAAARPTSTMWQGYIPNNHPLYTFLAHFALKWISGEPWSLRLPAFLAGIAMIPAAFWAGRRLYNEDAGILGAALVAGSSILIDYSTNARGYTMVGLAFLLLLAVAARLKTRSTLGGWLAFVILSSLGCFTIPVMLFPCGVVGLWLLLCALFNDVSRSRARMLAELGGAVMASILLTLVLYVPLMIGSGRALTTFQELEPEAYAVLGPHVWDAAAAALGLWRRDIPWPLVGGLIVGFITALFVNRRVSRHRIPAIIGIIWCVVVVLIQRAPPFPRVWMFLLPLVFIVASAGLAFFWPRRLGISSGTATDDGLMTGRPVTDDRRRPEPSPDSASLPPNALRTRTICAIAVILAAGLGCNVYRSGSPIDSAETGAFPDAPRMTRDLSRQLRRGDLILLTKTSVHEFHFYAFRARIGREYLEGDPAQADRIFIPSAGARSSAEKMLAKSGVDPGDFDRPELVKRYQYASLYVVNRHHGATLPSDPIGPARELPRGHRR